MPNINAGNTAWVLASTALVLFMTPGLAFFYGGMVRRKNVLGMLMQNYVVMGLVGVVWVWVTYSLAFGPDWGGHGLIGSLHFAGLANVDTQAVPGYTGSLAQSIPPLVFVIFQMMFAVITVGLITGSSADRLKFGAFVTFAVAWSILVYAPVAHWVFSPTGWLAKRGAEDFAGGTVVHINAAMAGLALAVVAGRRKGWPEKKMEPHNVPFILLGGGILWFGWFGFNAGSELGA
ncbi:MAG: ammonium transporter, Amt family, partial [Actinomycetota bacterium]|nr:ammonium transporter, Amt family [Actinomycetota bacterium]